MFSRISPRENNSSDSLAKLQAFRRCPSVMAYDVKEILKNHTVTLKFLGQGSYSRVYLGYDT